MPVFAIEARGVDGNGEPDRVCITFSGRRRQRRSKILGPLYQPFYVRNSLCAFCWLPPR